MDEKTTSTDYDDYEPTFGELVMLLEAMGENAKIIDVTTGKGIQLG